MSTEREEFIQVCHDLKQEILASLDKQFSLPSETIQWIREMIEYNCIGGKLNRGISVIHCAKALTEGKEFSSELKHKASILGWCIEWLQAFFLVADDIMDDSVMRRGQPCWYRKPHVKLIAINDAFLLETFVFQIIKTHFRNEPYYSDLVDLFHDVIYRTELGQLLDLTSQPLDEATRTIDLSRFTMERYRKIVIFKTAYYTFYLSVASAMLLSGFDMNVNKNMYEVANEICLSIGEYFQIQDDFLDCFGAPEVIGKIGTDIQECKCSWLIVQALSLVNPEQKQILQDHYGKSEPDSVELVKELYRELNLESVFHTYEESVYKDIHAKIDQVNLMPSSVFTMLVSKIFKRNK